jgi:hypothetical protein
MQYVKSTILEAFDKDAFYTISDLLKRLPELTYATLERNIRHYHYQGLLKRQKVEGSRRYQYSISKKGMKRWSF